MSKKEICESNSTFGYYSGFGGVELKHVEYGINDYIYCVSGAWCSKKSYHKLKVYYNDNGDYIKINGIRIPLNECIRV